MYKRQCSEYPNTVSVVGIYIEVVTPDEIATVLDNKNDSPDIGKRIKYRLSKVNSFSALVEMND